jgi:hypothetical protein
MFLILKNDARSLTSPVTTWLSYKNLLTHQEMFVHLFFTLTVSIRWRLLFPTLCWSINTKLMVRLHLIAFKQNKGFLYRRIE